MTERDGVPIRGLATGVPGLDQVLGGSIPEYSFNLVAGEPGTGKTTLVQQILFANATPERPALYFTVLGEPTLKMLRYQQQFSFFDVEAVGTALRLVNLGCRLPHTSTESGPPPPEQPKPSLADRSGDVPGSPGCPGCQIQTGHVPFLVGGVLGAGPARNAARAARGKLPGGPSAFPSSVRSPHEQQHHDDGDEHHGQGRNHDGVVLGRSGRGVRRCVAARHDRLDRLEGGRGYPRPR